MKFKIRQCIKNKNPASLDKGTIIGISYRRYMIVWGNLMGDGYYGIEYIDDYYDLDLEKMRDKPLKNY